MVSDKNETVLAVCLITYNHVKFIRQAIEGILMQKVNFSWQLIIADDYSIDGTREIILEYKNKYPDFIHLIFQDKNVGPAKNWLDLITRPRSKYIAYFEGDDYWTDPFKLQKQVDFLEMHHHYSMVANKVFIDVNGNLNKFIYGHQEFTLENILHHGPMVHTASILFRNVLSENDLDLLAKATLGDWMLVILLSKHGKIKLLEDYMAAYRIHENGVYAPLSIENKVKKNIEFQMNVISVLPEFKNLLLKEIDSKMKFYSLYDYSLKSYLKGNSSLRIFLYGLRVKLNLKNRFLKTINRKKVLK
jgi:glycosyltransferase involved in cell wall biosynthesis